MSRLARLLSSSVMLRISAVLTLIALALMVWSVLVPTPMPVMIAMTVGQGIGTAAFALFGWVVFKDLTRVRRAKRDSVQNLAPKERDSLQSIALTKDEP